MHIDNTKNIIDSRDVIARIDELMDERDDAEELGELEEWKAVYEDELVALCAFANEGEYYVTDWSYGEALIRYDYFKQYAKEFAHDTGMVGENLEWPLRHIDWRAAAEELKLDYVELDFNGVPYYARA